jgi:hypothetical protein
LARNGGATILAISLPTHLVTLIMTPARFTESEARQKQKNKSLLRIRVARFFLVQNTKTEKIYQITTNYSK